MVVSIATLVKTPNNTVVQSDPNGIANPKTVHRPKRTLENQMEKNCDVYTTTTRLTEFKN